MTTANRNAKRRPFGLYIHIPFCASRCRYCGFLSFAGHDASADIQDAYVSALLSEVKYYGGIFGREASTGRRVIDTIFIGGGTPGFIDERHISRILDAVRESFDVGPGAEITIEVNPGTAAENKLGSYRNDGINRLSIGAQSLDDKMLKTLGRTHSTDDFYRTFNAGRKRGFNNIGCDIMFGFPGHDSETWKDTLRRVTELAPEHISFYSMQIEEGTEFGRLFNEGKLDVVPDETDRDMYRFAVSFLRDAGYEQYEISNAARPGYYSRHNMKYWNMDDYLGLGLGASSFMDGVRFRNTQDMRAYTENAAKGAVVWKYRNEPHDTIEEFVFTGLRKTAGISLDEFRARFGHEFFDIYKDVDTQGHIDRGSLEIARGMLRLTPDGIDISNAVMADYVGLKL